MAMSKLRNTVKVKELVMIFACAPQVCLPGCREDIAHFGWSHIAVFGEPPIFTPSLNPSFFRKAKARNHPKFNRAHCIHQMPLSSPFSKECPVRSSGLTEKLILSFPSA